jgi:hypothetical protein
MKPWLFDHRDERGPRGKIARWWYARRVRRIKAALPARTPARPRAVREREGADARSRR